MQDQDLLRQVAGIMFDYTLHGNSRRLGSPIHEKIVEFGLAQFKKVMDDKDITANEPLALLASASYLNLRLNMSPTQPADLSGT